MPDFAAALEQGRQIVCYEGSDPTGIFAASDHAKAVIRRLVECLEQARPTQTDFVELPKDRLFSPEEAAARKRWAEEFIAKLAGVARAHGYGIFQGGTLVRDIDVVAVPWRDPMPHKTPDLFVLALCHDMRLMMGNRGTTIHGHRWYALWDLGHRDHQIDLKVILPAKRPDA